MGPSTPINEDRFRQLWDGDSETDCVEVCRDLQRVGIEYRTTQQLVSRTSRMGVEWKFKVYVLDSDYQSAKRALGYGEQTESDDSVFELEETIGTNSDFNQDYAARSRAFLRRWDPQGATVEVGSLPATDESSTVELSLTENLIHYRVEHLTNGARKYFVHAEDEARAREIFREIKTGDPPS